MYEFGNGLPCPPTPNHYCRLNTCISARNYLHFYFLGVTGSLLYGYMLTVGILVQFLVPKEDLIDVFGTESGARVPWGVFAAVSAWVALSFVILAAFHTYLLCIGLGTFDWVVLQVRNTFVRVKTRGFFCLFWCRKGCLRWSCQPRGRSAPVIFSSYGTIIAISVCSSNYGANYA